MRLTGCQRRSRSPANRSARPPHAEIGAGHGAVESNSDFGIGPECAGQFCSGLLTANGSAADHPRPRSPSLAFTRPRG